MTEADKKAEYLHRLLNQWRRPQGTPGTMRPRTCSVMLEEGCRTCNFRRLMGLRDDPGVVCPWAAEADEDRAIEALETALAIREENGYAQR